MDLLLGARKGAASPGASIEVRGEPRPTATKLELGEEVELAWEANVWEARRMPKPSSSSSKPSGAPGALNMGEG